MFYWSHRITLIECRRKLYESMNNRRQGTVGAFLVAGCNISVLFDQDIFLISFWTLSLTRGLFGSLVFYFNYWGVSQISFCCYLYFHSFIETKALIQIVAVPLLIYAQLFVIPWMAACLFSLAFLISQSLLKFISMESVMLSNHLILCCSLLLLPSVFPIIKVFPSKSALCIRGQCIGASALVSILPMNIQS